MKKIFVALAIGFTLSGCGPSKSDNSKIQTPDDEPIGFSPNVGGEGKPPLKGKVLPGQDLKVK